MSRLELRVPPDVLALALAGVMWLASAMTPAVAVPTALRVTLAASLIIGGAGLIVAARGVFQRARTTWSPATPGRTSSLVTGGVYALTRNPMYLGTLLALLGWAVVLESPLALALSAVFVPYMDRYQIGPEERALSALLGRDYAEYLLRVRRWL